MKKTNRQKYHNPEFYKNIFTEIDLERAQFKLDDYMQECNGVTDKYTLIILQGELDYISRRMRCTKKR